MNNIKKFRIEKNYTLKKLAELVGISSGYLCHLEKGTRENPSYKVMFKISRILGKNIEEIFNNETI